MLVNIYKREVLEMLYTVKYQNIYYEFFVYYDQQLKWLEVIKVIQFSIHIYNLYEAFRKESDSDIKFHFYVQISITKIVR